MAKAQKAMAVTTPQNGRPKKEWVLNTHDPSFFLYILIISITYPMNGIP
jgi:hypothetical protein